MSAVSVVLSGRGLCDELITHPEESYRLWCVVVCDLEKKLMNEEAIARVGLQRKKRKASPLISFFINKQLLYGSHMCTCFSAVHYVHHGTLVLKVWPFSKIKKKSKAISGQALKVPERRGSQIS